MDFVTATYRLRCAASEAEALAQHIALEQTVEVPEPLLTDPRIREAVVGRIRSVLPIEPPPESGVPGAEPAPGWFDVRIDYPADVAGPHVGQMWNLLYGNISLGRGVRLIDVQLPESLQSRLSGPRLGIAGLRDLLGVEGRPLLATALKPRGSSDEHLAQLAAAFAAGGGHLVKDDHNLVDPDFPTFLRRIDLALTAVDRVQQQTSRRTLYAPNLSPPIEQLDRYAEALLDRGVAAVLIAPMLLGLDTTRRLTGRYPFVYLGHPTFTGAYFQDRHHGVAPAVLLGQWFRWIGCDVTIFPNHGGRFTFTPEECAAIVQACRRPEDHTRPAWPAPAGGMSYHRLPEMAAAYGADSIFLIGGALLADSADLAHSTRRFDERIAAEFPGATTTPRMVTPVVSARSTPHLLRSRPGRATNDADPLAARFVVNTPQSSRARSTSAAAGEETAAPVATLEAPHAEATMITELPSACEWQPNGVVTQPLLEYLAFHTGYRWDGRAPVAYKTDERLPFRGVERTELIGQQGERTAFDVRYFEIAPGGYSSLERHQHTHVVIGLRGTGTLLNGSERQSVRPLDIAYVPPLRVHQLRNESAEPFGFLCIVDHERDRPQPPE